jgi:hypothetical protein
MQPQVYPATLSCSMARLNIGAAKLSFRATQADFLFPIPLLRNGRPAQRGNLLSSPPGSRSKKSSFERPVVLSVRTGLSALSFSTPVLHLYFVATTYFPSEGYSVGMAGVLFRLAPKNPICRRGLAIEGLSWNSC